MGDSLKSLHDLSAGLPAGVEQSAALIAQLDACFVVGFSRLGEAQLQALLALVRVTAGSPLATAVSEAVQAIERAEFLDKHFAALACARSALQGAMHDALLDKACAALGRSAPPPPEDLLSPTIPPAPPHHTVFLESARKFLTRIALAGFSQLEMDPLVQFYLTLDKIQSEPGLIRQAAVLSGFLGELLAAMPIDAKATLPIYRWVDLWTRCMLLAVKPPAPARSEVVSGELKLLGCDLHHHPSLISACAYGLLFRAGSAPQLVRATVSAYKVDLVQGAEMWRMFDGVADRLTGALRNRLTLKIDGMTLLKSGDLIWDDARASHGPSYNPIELAMAHAAPGKELARPAALAAERHPVLLAEPVALTGYAVKKIGDAAKGKKNPTAAELIDDLGIELGGATLPLTGTRLSAASGLTAEHIEKSQQLLGLLRFDRGRWALQPLAVAVGKGVELAGTPAASIKSKDDTVSILKERASKLLRKK
jgi:hypothetical protein